MSTLWTTQDPKYEAMRGLMDSDYMDKVANQFNNALKDGLDYLADYKGSAGGKVQNWTRIMNVLGINNWNSEGVKSTLNTPKGIKGIDSTIILQFNNQSKEYAQYLSDRLLTSGEDTYELDINSDGTLRVGHILHPGAIDKDFISTDKRGGHFNQPIKVTAEINAVNAFLKVYARINGMSIQDAYKGFYTTYFTPALKEMLNKNDLDEFTEDVTMAEDVNVESIAQMENTQKKSPIASLVESVIPSVAAADFKSKAGQETLIKTINNFVDSGVKIKPQQFLTLSKAVAEIESRGKGKTAVGTSTTGGIYYGTYQMGKAAIGDAAADLKEVIPDHKTQPKEYKKWVTNTFLNDEDMQERFYGIYTNKSNKHLMNVSSKYRKMSIKKKLEMLAGAQLGMGNVVKFINGDKSFKDGNGKGIQYFIDRYIKYRDSK